MVRKSRTLYREQKWQTRLDWRSVCGEPMKEKVKRECNPEHRSNLPAEWKEKRQHNPVGHGATLSHKLRGRLSRRWEGHREERRTRHRGQKKFDWRSRHARQVPPCVTIQHWVTSRLYIEYKSRRGAWKKIKLKEWQSAYWAFGEKVLHLIGVKVSLWAFDIKN